MLPWAHLLQLLQVRVLVAAQHISDRSPWRQHPVQLGKFLRLKHAEMFIAKDLQCMRRECAPLEQAGRERIMHNVCLLHGITTAYHHNHIASHRGADLYHDLYHKVTLVYQLTGISCSLASHTLAQHPSCPTPESWMASGVASGMATEHAEGQEGSLA